MFAEVNMQVRSLRCCLISLRRIHAGSTGSKKSPPGKFIQIGRSRVHYEIVGHGKHHLFLIPGGMGSARNDWPHLMNDLNRDKFTLIGWDPPGFGFTGSPDYLDSLDAFLKDAEVASQLIRTLGIKKVSVLGWCSGGQTAMLTAARNPDIMDKLVLLATAWQIDDRLLKIWEANNGVNQWIPLLRDPLVELHGLEYSQFALNKFLKMLRNREQSQGQEICKEEFAKIKCPTLIIHSLNDTWMPIEYGIKLSQKIKQSKFIQLQTGNHYPHFANPSQFNKLIEAFLTDGYAEE